MSESITFNLPYKVKIIDKPIINFSIVILTKNNEEELKKLLNSLENFKNNKGEIFILDLGSTDNTINIANDFDCKVEDGSNFLRIVDIDMCNIINDKFDSDKIGGIIEDGNEYFDYSGARNYAASLASNNMILMLDINTDIIEFNISEIENFINDGYDMLKFIVHNKNNNVYGFYNRLKYNWINVIYETLNNNHDDDIREIDIPDSILRVESKKNDTKNKIVGLSINCFLNPYDERLSQLFAIELFNLNFINSAYNEFNRHLTICNSLIKRCESLVYIGDYFIKKQQDIEGLQYYHKAYLEYSDIRLPLYKLGQYFFIRKDWKKSIFYLEGCLNISKTNEIDNDDFMYKDGPYSMLYVNYWWIGNIKQGKYYFDKALEIDPYNQLYIDEAIFHYKYKGNTIRGYLSYQQIQALYNESKKVKSILEIYPDNARGTHALLAGCDGIVTVLLKNTDSSFLQTLDNPGNLRIINMEFQDAIKYLNNEKFDMVFINGNDNDNNYNEILNHSKHCGYFIWEKFANKLLCGSNYEKNKQLIDSNFETLNIDDIWYKNISSFEKAIIYKRK